MANYYVKLTDEEKEITRFVGPYSDKVEAVSAEEEAKKLNIKTEILPQIRAKKLGLKSPHLGNKSNTLLGTIVPKTKTELEQEISIDNQNIKKTTNKNKNKNKKGNGKMDSTIIAEDTVLVSDETEIENEIVTGFEKSEALIITKYPSNVEWLRQNGVFGDVKSRAYPHEIQGKSVVGILPYRLGSIAKRVGIIDLPELKANMVGQMLDTNQLYEAGAKLRWFRVYEETGNIGKILRFLDDEKNIQKVLKLIK